MRSNMLVALLVTCLAAAAPALGADPGHGDMTGHKHLALFLGVGEEDTASGQKHDAEAVGVEYEYRLNNEWGIGAVVERLDVHGKTNTVVVVPFSYHFGGGFRAFFGPGYEFKAVASKDKALARIGLGYEFHVNEHWTIAPEVLNDFIDGGYNTWLVGVAIGYGFH